MRIDSATSLQELTFKTTTLGLEDDSGFDVEEQTVVTAQDREAAKLAEDKAEREAQTKAQMQAIRDYIETYGAPEEKDQDAYEETLWSRLQEQEDDEKKRGLPGNALQTGAVVIQDPEDEGKMHVYTVKTNREGQGKITRHTQFDSGDGEDRSHLTAKRRQAANVYEHGGIKPSTHGSGDDKKVEDSV